MNATYARTASGRFVIVTVEQGQHVARPLQSASVDEDGALMVAPVLGAADTPADLLAAL